MSAPETIFYPSGELPNDFCIRGATPYSLTAFLRQLLIDHFSDPNRIENPDLRGYVWTGDDASPLLIESITRWRPRKTENRPAILIKRNDWQVQRQGIDHRLMGGFSLEGELDYDCLVSGSHSVFCISNNGAEAEILGHEVFRLILHYAPLIRQTINLDRLDIAGLSSLQKVEEAQDNFVTATTLQYVFQEKWSLVPQAPTLKSVAFQTNTD
jgi:hypothetical protein